MTSVVEENCWVSAYIYFDGNIYSDECDFVIKQILVPFLEDMENSELFKRYFFIRYSEGGTHIRVRFYGNTLMLENKLRPLFENKINRNLSKFFTDMNKNGGEKVLDPKKFFIKWIPYEPETERYGGKEAVKIAEEFFFYSSVTANEIIKHFGTNDKSSRLGKGLALMVILLFKFCVSKEMAGKLVSNYSSGYLKAIAKEEKYQEVLIESFDAGFNSQSKKLVELVNTLWDILEENEELPYVLESYSKNLDIIYQKLRQGWENNKVIIRETQVYDWDTCVFSIIPSYIHMMNNRLGIAVYEESYLAHLIAKGILIEQTVTKGHNDV